MENIIKVNQLTKHLSGTRIIDAMTFQVKKGEIFGFLGPSGSGKTTTIKMLTGKYYPSGGEIEVLGFPQSKIGSSAFANKVGILSDHSALYERLTVQDNLMLFAKLYDMPQTKIEEALAFVDLADSKKKVIKTLSAGMKQRVLLAKTIMHEPELLFLDEPTSSLDPMTMAHIHNGLKALNEKGTTIFLTTHNMEEANHLCHRVAFIESGMLKVIGTPEELRFRHSNQTIKVIHKNGNVKRLDMNMDAARYISDMIEVDDLKFISSDLPSLGDVFLKVTGKELL
ncbi:Fluoroquinolones export ATP-binding protein Rv2688c/MT2762 [Listeria grayi]|uniref:ABC transporter, ATP-binding protein n=3 Tax=Listeria grayi TaxID=1641 RepID=D7UW78_LISGR|nr:ABC transporter ATP-binding protein [Listeria grayi]EFI84806.1 ABC transporter, ATP-binding protein [Listeria grayi DSM 20601]EUJ28311.1 ABC transporter-like protein [Listeria grayi FSL F6-1183]STY44389.1 Fluoroquinolones export ATP-binding protein Rv2688c/MT2762 [Listeria grayi]VEI36284.1 Fluoroquinolones export ATP-binding protein Rv2688c/MT2762 [Listeria grayi]